MVVVVGSHRTRSELRKRPRKQFHYNASILTGPDALPLPCALVDISEIGARVTLSADDALPDEFVLMFSKSGKTRRWCHVVWREGATVGLEFIRGPGAKPADAT